MSSVSVSQPTRTPGAAPTWATEAKIVDDCHFHDCGHGPEDIEEPCLVWFYGKTLFDDYRGPTGMLVEVVRYADLPAELRLEMNIRSSVTKTLGAAAAFQMAAALYQAGVALLEDERSRLAP
jgi:hypothetical protein